MMSVTIKEIQGLLDPDQVIKTEIKRDSHVQLLQIIQNFNIYLFGEGQRFILKSLMIFGRCIKFGLKMFLLSRLFLYDASIIQMITK
jgi:hypothetical protein